jgi:hypothetical protein
MNWRGFLRLGKRAKPALRQVRFITGSGTASCARTSSPFSTSTRVESPGPPCSSLLRASPQFPVRRGSGGGGGGNLRATQIRQGRKRARGWPAAQCNRKAASLPAPLLSPSPASLPSSSPARAYASLISSYAPPRGVEWGPRSIFLSLHGNLFGASECCLV